MSGHDNYLAAVGYATVAGQIIYEWGETLRAQIVQWSVQNRVELIGVGIWLRGARQTPNGTILLIHVEGILPNKRIIDLIDVEAPYVVGEAFGLVYQGYPVDKAQILFTQDELYAEF